MVSRWRGVKPTVALHGLASASPFFLGLDRSRAERGPCVGCRLRRVRVEGESGGLTRRHGEHGGPRRRGRRRGGCNRGGSRCGWQPERSPYKQRVWRLRRRVLPSRSEIAIHPRRVWRLRGFGLPTAVLRTRLSTSLRMTEKEGAGLTQLKAAVELLSGWPGRRRVVLEAMVSPTNAGTARSRRRSVGRFVEPLDAFGGWRNVLGCRKLFVFFYERFPQTQQDRRTGRDQRR